MSPALGVENIIGKRHHPFLDVVYILKSHLHLNVFIRLTYVKYVIVNNFVRIIDLLDIRFDSAFEVKSIITDKFDSTFINFSYLGFAVVNDPELQSAGQ